MNTVLIVIWVVWIFCSFAFTMENGLDSVAMRPSEFKEMYNCNIFGLWLLTFFFYPIQPNCCNLAVFTLDYSCEEGVKYEEHI